MTKIKLLLITGLLAVFLLPSLARAAGDTIYLFYSETCPHCAEEELFLQKWQKQDSDLEVKLIEVSANKDNAAFLRLVGNELGVNVRGVPFTVIGNRYIEGFYNDEVTGEQIKLYLEQCRQLGCEDIVGNILAGVDNNREKLKTEEKDDLSDEIKLPFLGNINWRDYSLPVLTIIIGVLDGFNPCAMWVLIFLIGLLLGMENRRRMWTLGIIFLVASAAVYFIFMAAWLNLLIFLGLVVWVRVLIGLVALAGGGLNVRQWWTNKQGVCKVNYGGRKQKIFAKLKAITEQKSFLLALTGIILLAFAVNLVELICSAGLPAIYTQVLALSGLAAWQYYLYLLLYILFFLIDDIIVFSVAMITLQITGISTKYSRYSNLIGGVLMLIIGLLLIFRPEWLMFG